MSRKGRPTLFVGPTRRAFLKAVAGGKSKRRMVESVWLNYPEPPP